MLLAILHAREVPLGELPHVHSTLERIALKARVPKPRLYLIEDGHLRSLSAGTGPRRSGIAVTRGLLGAARAEELEGLLAHEIAHIRRRDVPVQTLVAMLTLTILESSRLGWRAQGALLYVLGPSRLRRSRTPSWRRGVSSRRRVRGLARRLTARARGRAPPTRAGRRARRLR